MSDFDRFYVATDYARKPDAQEVADLLESKGMRCAARWCRTQPTFKDGGLGGELTGDDAAAALRVAEEDLEDIFESYVFVQLTSGEKARGGRHVELGYALAYALHDNLRTVVVVGPREHAFHYHPRVVHLSGLDELAGWAENYMAGARL